MKQILNIIVLFFSLTQIVFSQHPSAITEFESTSQGLLIPRMTDLDRGNINLPADGLLVYQTNNQAGFYYYDGGWIYLNPSSTTADKISDADNNTEVHTEKSSNNNQIHYTLDGTTYFMMDGPRLIVKNNGGNIAIGDSTLLWNSGTNNTSLGDQSGHQNTTGSNNSFIGKDAGRHNTTGSQNVAMGHAALYSNTSSSGLVAIGDSSLYGNLAGRNTAVGFRSGRSTTIGYNNTFVGYESGYNNESGYWNTFVGLASGYHSNGYGNSFFGNTAGYHNEGGDFNTLIGTAAGFTNKTGHSNSFVGLGAGYFNTSGDHNVAFGKFAFLNNTFASENVAIGDSSLFNNGAGVIDTNQRVSNTAIGYRAGRDNESGTGQYIGWMECWPFKPIRIF